MPLFNFKKVASCFLIVSVLFFGILSETQARGSRSGSIETLYQKAKQSYYLLKNSRKKRAYRHHWMATIQKFVAVYESDPSSPQAYNAMFTVARLYHQLYSVTKNSRDREKALHFYYKVISEYKAGRLTDDALYHQGKINFDKKNYPEALASFESIFRNFPKGDQVVKARKLRRKIVPLVLPRKVVQAKVRHTRAAKPVLLKKVNYSRKPHSTRVVIQTGGPAKITQNKLSNPNRVYFNFLNTRLDQRIKKDIRVGSDTLKRLRVSQFDKTTSRLVLEIPSDTEVNVTTTRKNGKLIVDLIAPDKKTVLIAKTKPPAISKLTANPKIAPIIKPVPVAISPKAKIIARKEVPLIVIDPGHGGKDNGAKSSHGLLEKDVNLKISKRLKKILEFRYGYQVILTRTDDTFIPLKERGEIANERNADLFVSVHANAAKRLSAHGIETYYLGNANSEQAQETAARENGKLVHSVKDGQVQQILASLISTTKINDSALLAGHVQERIHSSIKKKYSNVKDLGVKEGPFFVLHDTKMPSILVEVGFITNSREEQRLRKSAYLDRLADSIARGIHEYKKDRGPTI